MMCEEVKESSRPASGSRDVSRMMDKLRAEKGNNWCEEMLGFRAGFDMTLRR